jgi:Uma2 family endonuclease
MALRAAQPTRYISANEYAVIVDLPEYADRLIELVDGEIVEMTKPGGRHGVLTMRIAGRLL